MAKKAAPAPRILQKAKRIFYAFSGITLLGAASLLYYAQSVNGSQIVLRRLYNTFIYTIGMSSWRQDDFGNLTVHGIVSVYDGDTFTCNIEDLHPLIGERVSIRINGIDTPEMNDKNPDIKYRAIKARDYLNRLLNTAEKIELRNVRRGKYFRILADVYADETNISHKMLERGLAQSYDGGTKESWDAKKEPKKGFWHLFD